MSKDGKDGYPSTRKDRVLPPPSVGQRSLAKLEKAHLLHSDSQFSCQSVPKISSQTNAKIMFYQLSGHHLAQSSWYLKFTITPSSSVYPTSNSPPSPVNSVQASSGPLHWCLWGSGSLVNDMCLVLSSFSLYHAFLSQSIPFEVGCACLMPHLPTRIIPNPQYCHFLFLSLMPDLNYNTSRLMVLFCALWNTEYLEKSLEQSKCSITLVE